MKKIISLLKKHKDIIIAASIAIILFLTALWCTVIFPFSQIAHADYETDIIQNQNAVLSFNQLLHNDTARPDFAGITVSYKGNGVVNFNGAFSNDYEAYYRIYNNYTFDIIQDHKYYINTYSNYNTHNVFNFAIYNSSPDTFLASLTLGGNIYTAISSLNCYVGVKLFPNNSYNDDFSFYVIDLTQCFGESNEPTVDQAQQLFVADYYQYTAGTPVSFNTTDAYVNGMNAFLQATKFTINTYDFINSAFGVTLTNEYAGVIEKDYNSGYLTLMPAPTDTSSQTPTCCIPFRMALPQGTQVTISGKCYSSVYSGASPVYVGFWDGSQMYEVQEQFRVGSGSGGQGYRFIETTVTVTLPFEASQMYIYYGYDSGTMYLKDFSVGYYVTDLDILKAASYQGGYDDAETYYKNYYSYGGSGYQDIFNAGVRSTQENGAVFQDSWSFVGTAFSGIGSILAVELFPNVPIGVFVAFPLLLGLIFFIVKLTKGGS